MTLSYDDLEREVLENPEARAASHENALRRDLAAVFEEARTAMGLSIRGLATELGTSISQVQRLLHQQLGGSLTLYTICRAADRLGLSVSLHVRPTNMQSGCVVGFPRVMSAQRSTTWRYSYDAKRPVSTTGPRGGWQSADPNKTAADGESGCFGEVA